MKQGYKGILVVNHFLNTNKYNELYEYFLEASKEFSVELILKTNAELVVCEDRIRSEAKEYDFVLFWDKDIRLAQRLESYGYRLFNQAKAIEVCDDKSYTYQELLKADIPMPKTILGPKTFETVGYNDVSFLDQVILQLGLPLVLKECYGSFGMQVYLAKTKEELCTLLKETKGRPVLFQQFMEESKGRDVRIQVIGDQVVASMYRYSESSDFRANLSIGGKMKQYTPSKEECDLALSCCKQIGLDFAGVDLLFGPDGKPLVCEVNSNAHFKNIYDCTGVNAASLIIRHIVTTLKKG